MEPDCPEHHSRGRRGSRAALLFNGAHRHVRCRQCHRARLFALSRRAARTRPGIVGSSGRAGSARRPRRPQSCGNGDLRCGPRGSTRTPPDGIRSPRRRHRRPRCQGDPDMASGGRLDRRRAAALRRACPARTLAADAAEQPRRRVHTSPARDANGAPDPDAVPAATAAAAHERRLCNRPPRGAGPRPLRQHGQDARTDADRQALGQRQRRRGRHGHP